MEQQEGSQMASSAHSDIVLQTPPEFPSPKVLPRTAAAAAEVEAAAQPPRAAGVQEKDPMEITSSDEEIQVGNGQTSLS